jgi:5-methylcytosine-specific restriction endonuclease McrA
MTRLPSIEEFADKTGNTLRKVVKGALLRLAPEFKTAKVRRRLLLKQERRCPICGKLGNVLVDNGRETHVDHKWTTDEAANAVLDGTIDLISAYSKLWAPENLQAVHATCNFGKNKKDSVRKRQKLALDCAAQRIPQNDAAVRRPL